MVSPPPGVLARSAAAWLPLRVARSGRRTSNTHHEAAIAASLCCSSPSRSLPRVTYRPTLPCEHPDPPFAHCTVAQRSCVRITGTQKAAKSLLSNLQGHPDCGCAALDLLSGTEQGCCWAAASVTARAALPTGQACARNHGTACVQHATIRFDGLCEQPCAPLCSTATNLGGWHVNSPVLHCAVLPQPAPAPSDPPCWRCSELALAATCPRLR